MRKAKGDTALALADLNDGLTREPDNVVGLLTRAQIRQGKGETAGAIADYDAALRRDPKNLAALNARAMALMQTRSYAKAADDFDRVIQLEPKNAQAYYQRGLAREQDKQFAEAAADYKMALDHDRTLSDARKALARAEAAARNNKPRVAEPKQKARTHGGVKPARLRCRTPAPRENETGAAKPLQDAKAPEPVKQALPAETNLKSWRRKLRKLRCRKNRPTKPSTIAQRKAEEDRKADEVAPSNR